MEQDELTLKQAAEHVGCSKSLVDGARVAGLIPARRVGPEGPGGMWVVKVADVEAWNAKRQPRGRKPKPTFYEYDLLGTVGAGPLQDEPMRGVSVKDFGEPIPGHCVAYLVAGDSMESEGLSHNDVILVRTDPRYQDGDTVVAWVWGDDDTGGCVVKKYRERTKGGRLVRWLESPRWQHELTDRDRVYGVYERKRVAEPKGES